MKFMRDGWVLSFEFTVPGWVFRLLRMQPDPRTLAHGKSSRSWRDKHGMVEVTVTETEVKS